MTKTVHIGWVYLTAILALAVASLAWDRCQTSKALKDVFFYSYRVTLVDAASGKILPAGIASPSTSSTDLFQQSQETAIHPDGGVTIIGVAYLPRKFEFTSTGYESKSLTIGPRSSFTDDIQVKLTRMPNAVEQKSGQRAAPSDDGKLSN